MIIRTMFYTIHLIENISLQNILLILLMIQYMYMIL